MLGIFMRLTSQRPLRSSSANIDRNVKLLRRIGSDGKKYRIVITGMEQVGLTRPRQQSKPHLLYLSVFMLIRRS
jgi:hypothetical protein